MKCPGCGKDCKYKEREDGKCPSCRRVFVFEPKRGDKMTDARFQTALDVVSSEGEVWWTEEHLHHVLARRSSKSGPLLARAFGIMGATVFLLLLAMQLWVGAVLVLVVVIVGVIQLSKGAFQRLPSEQVDEYLGRWKAVHGRPNKLIVRRPLPAPGARPLDADIPEYSFDRAVICDRASTVDVLLANQFHFENNCAVLGAKGYPQANFDVVLEMLKKNPRLAVYVLHDATSEGCALSARVARSPRWFQGLNLRIVDVGLAPRHAQSLKNFWQRDTRAPKAEPGFLTHLSDAERKWLADGYYVELAAIRPEQLIKRLYRAISAERSGTLDVVDVDTTSITTHTTVVDGGGDSFG